MRFQFSLSPVWSPLFTLTGFWRKRTYIELDNQGVTFHFGTAHETVPYSNLKSIAPRRKWIYLLGVGPKLGPDGGVSYVGSLAGVVQLRFKEPVSMEVWLGIRHPKAKCVTVSLEDPEGFIKAVEEQLASENSQH